MDSLDVNDTCKRPITNLKRHFVYGEIIQIHTIHESNYTVINQPRNGSGKVKIINKSNSVYRSYQAQVMRRRHSMIFAYIIHAYVDTSQRSIKDIFNIFQKGSLFGLDDYINFEHASSHKYVVQTTESLRMARSEMTRYSFLVLIKLQSSSETVYEAFDFSLKLFSVLSKQLA